MNVDCVRARERLRDRPGLRGVSGDYRPRLQSQESSSSRLAALAGVEGEAMAKSLPPPAKNLPVCKLQNAGADDRSRGSEPVSGNIWPSAGVGSRWMAYNLSTQLARDEGGWRTIAFVLSIARAQISSFFAPDSRSRSCELHARQGDWELLCWRVVAKDGIFSPLLGTFCVLLRRKNAGNLDGGDGKMATALAGAVYNSPTVFADSCRTEETVDGSTEFRSSGRGMQPDCTGVNPRGRRSGDA
jgi:hypothetical protein